MGSGQRMSSWCSRWPAANNSCCRAVGGATLALQKAPGPLTGAAERTGRVSGPWRAHREGNQVFTGPLVQQLGFNIALNGSSCQQHKMRSWPAHRFVVCGSPRPEPGITSRAEPCGACTSN
ncbi:hypothetical protein XENOCAPTIV_001629 [Xenoophorus captivus]|uniref:Uncharacterized protein n=1 Tax=Xenoophorus captivus TaxID=1517983 RepID=A0ABV0S4Q2_9TELE